MHDDAIDRARALVAAAERVVALTGAGISTDSGIPDFRGPNGVWTKDPAAEKASTLSHYVADPAVRRAAWRNRLDSPAWRAEPNDGHRAFVALERQGRLHTLVTQNIDELHQRAGSDPARVVEVHGTMRRVTCLSCGESAPMERALDRVRAGEEDPDCRSCGGILKSATISFGQNLVPEDLERAGEAASHCDLFFAIGTSLGVYPAAYLPQYALQNGARLVIMNAQETPYDRYASAILRDGIGEVLPQVVALV